jgi:hypothetical protein
VSRYARATGVTPVGEEIIYDLAMAKTWAVVLTVLTSAVLVGSCSGGSGFSESQKRFEKEAKIYCPELESASNWSEWEDARYPLQLAQSTLGLLPTEITEVLNEVCPKGGEIGEKLARSECAADDSSTACLSLRD